MSTEKPVIVFMGTAEFGVPALRALHEKFGVRAVVTVPDKAAGRGRVLQPSAVKRCALELGIESILQPMSLRDPDFEQQIRELRPDIICVIAFRILPSSIYTLASKAAFNVHASLLPKFRGAAPINHAIMKGEKETGVTAFVLNDVVDTGNILLQERCGIEENMTAGELYVLLMPLAANAAVRSVEMLMNESWRAQQQDETMASPAPKVWREFSAIPWDKSADEVRHFIHGLSPTPCAWTMMGNERLKIYYVVAGTMSLEAGHWRIHNGSWQVGCADGSVELRGIQLPNKAAVHAEDFIRGWRGAREGQFGMPESNTSAP